jgi:hypothetical protein
MTIRKLTLEMSLGNRVWVDKPKWRASNQANRATPILRRAGEGLDKEMIHRV